MAKTTINHTSSDALSYANALGESSRLDPRHANRLRQAREDDLALYKFHLDKKYSELLLKDEKKARDKINEELAKRETYLKRQQNKVIADEFKKMQEESKTGLQK